MRRHDVLSVLFTFVVGFFAGAFLYVGHFGKLLNSSDVSSNTDLENFTIVGEAYGSCGNDCPSFQVLSDGSYRYEYAITKGSEAQIKSGTLPLEIRRALKANLKDSTLAPQTESIQPTDCHSYHGGIDVRYDVTLKGEEYNLDSCGTTVDGNSNAWNSLAQIWNYFETIRE